MFANVLCLFMLYVVLVCCLLYVVCCMLCVHVYVYVHVHVYVYVYMYVYVYVCEYVNVCVASCVLYPSTYNRTFPVQRNIQDTFGSRIAKVDLENAIAAYIYAARAHTTADFDVHMARLRAISLDIYDYVTSIAPAHWAISHMPFFSFGFLTTNSAGFYLALCPCLSS